MFGNHDATPAAAAKRKPIPIRSSADLGRVIRAARRRLGLSQSDMAAHLDVPRPYLSQLESGKETVHLRRLLETLSALGFDLYVERRSPR